MVKITILQQSTGNSFSLLSLLYLLSAVAAVSLRAGDELSVVCGEMSKMLDLRDEPKVNNQPKNVHFCVQTKRWTTIVISVTFNKGVRGVKRYYLQ